MNTLKGNYTQRLSFTLPTPGKADPEKMGSLLLLETILFIVMLTTVDIDMYENMYRKAIEDKAEAVCCNIVLEYDKFSKVLQYDNRHYDHQLMYDCIAPISVEYFSLCNRLVTRKVYEIYSIQPFENVNMWDDVDLTIRIRYHINSTSVINKAYYHYNLQNIVSTTKRPMLDRVKEQIMCVNYIEEFFKKNMMAKNIDTLYLI